MALMKEEEIILQEGKRILLEEAQALSAAAQTLGTSFIQAVGHAYKALQGGGKLIVSGVGKSGNVAQKLASTLTSTGSMTVYLHPTEALHGDLGVVHAKDVLFFFSHSGSTEEILRILPVLKGNVRQLIGILGNPQGALAQHMDLVVPAMISREACPHNLAPTTSSTVQMAIGDALAMCIQKKTGFGPEKYAQLHPGGSLGKRLQTKVADLMHKVENIALLSPEVKMEEVVLALTNDRLSAVCIVEAKAKGQKLLGVITEGDLRRALSHKERFFQMRAKDIMNTNPQTVLFDEKTSYALELMENRKWQLSFLPVVDKEGHCVGAIRVHDLVLAGLN